VKGITDWQGRPWSLESVLSNVGPGWHHLVCRLVRDLFNLGWDGELHQIKEKYGGLRFYIGSGSDEIHTRIHEAEDESYKTCYECGEPGKRRSGGWVVVMCDPCWEKEEKKRDGHEESYS
jgi:hypothetical protein